MQAHGMLVEIGHYWQSSRMLWLQPDALGEQAMDTGSSEKADFFNIEYVLRKIIKSEETYP